MDPEQPIDTRDYCNVSYLIGIWINHSRSTTVLIGWTMIFRFIVFFHRRSNFLLSHFRLQTKKEIAKSTMKIKMRGLTAWWIFCWGGGWSRRGRGTKEGEPRKRAKALHFGLSARPWIITRSAPLYYHIMIQVVHNSYPGESNLERSIKVKQNITEDEITILDLERFQSTIPPYISCV